MNNEIGWMFGSILLAFGVPQDNPIRIGIVNMKHCFDEAKCGLAKDRQAELRETKGKIEAELKELERQIRVKESQMMDVPKDGPLYRKLRKERAQLLATAKAKEEVGKIELQEFWRRACGEIYDRVCRYSEEIAKSRGLDLVLKDDASSEEPEPDKIQMPSDMRILYRAILYYNADRFDITKDVLARMNEGWQKEKRELDKK